MTVDNASGMCYTLREVIEMKTSLVRLSGRVFYMPNEEETDRPVLTYIRGDSFSLAVDAGNSPKHVRKFYDALTAHDLRLPDYTVLTHWHWDHTFGMCAARGATIACKQTDDKLRRVRAWAWTDDAMKARLQSGEDIEFCDQCIRLEYPDLSEICVKTADIVFTGAMTIHLGGLSCELRDFDSPHTRDHTLIYLPSEDMVIDGDGAGDDLYENGGKFDKKRLEAYIEALDAIPFSTYIGGHGEPESKESLMRYLNEELAAL